MQGELEAAPVRSERDGRRIGELLVDSTGIGHDEVERALKRQSRSGERLGSLLVNQGLISERDLAEALSRQLGLEIVAAEDYPETGESLVDVTSEFLVESKAVPLEDSEEGLVVAMADPLDRFTLDALRLATGRPIVARIGLLSDIETALRRLFANGDSSMTQIIDGIDVADDDEAGEDVETLRDLASEAPIIRLVNLIIGRAIESRASDIHIEPFENRLKVRFRIDGVLNDVEAPPVHSTAAVVSRIKVMAKLNIAERRLPQDGRIKLRIHGRDVDMRVSTVPTMHGESVVMRILDKGSVALDFASLGFEGEARARFDEMLARPQGIVLVTGPTGSGKTTTLYTALELLNTPEKKILTVEDPVEYQLEGINQIQIKPRIDLTFANALRSILRQDPDVIMVGEMRDLETAKIAVQSALTGHKVFSTLHTNDAASSVTRLLDMGVEDYLVTSTVNGIVAQRLVRRLCGSCREPYRALPELVAELGIEARAGSGEIEFFRPRGCDACGDTGFFGRVGIAEVLLMSDPLRRCILSSADASEVRRAARELGTRSMFEDGIGKALAGVTTVEEVERVTRDA